MKSNKRVGVFEHESNAFRSIERLIEAGFNPSDISVLYHSESEVENLKKLADTDIHMKRHTELSNTEAGTVTGGILGGFGGLLASLGLAAVPGAGPLLAAGPAASALGGLVTGGAIGGLIGSLTGMGFTRQEAELYDRYLNEDKIIVFVEDDEGIYQDRVHKAFHDNESIIRDTYKFNTDTDDYKKLK